MLGRFSLGRFGWFTPKELTKNDQIHSPPIPYTIFKSNSGEQFERFLLNTTVLKELLVLLLLCFSCQFSIYLSFEIYTQKNKFKNEIQFKILFLVNLKLNMCQPIAAMNNV